MWVTINLPEKIEHQLKEQWGDLPRRTLAALALEGYRSGALSARQVAEVLQLSVWENESFLYQHGAEFDYTAEDLERDMARSARVLPTTGRAASSPSSTNTTHSGGRSTWRCVTG